MLYPVELRDRKPALMCPEPLTAELEIVGIGLDRTPLGFRLENLILDAMLLCIGNRFLLGVEAEGHLCSRIARAGPAHERLDLARTARLEIEHPFPGLGPAGLHGGLGGFVDAGACQF